MIKRLKYSSVFLVISILIGAFLSACKPGEPEIDIDLQKTSFAQTAEAQTTQTAAALEAEQPTATTEAIQPTPTLTPTTDNPAETSVPGEQTATATPNPQGQPTASSTPLNATDAAAWRANDPPDNTDFKPGEEFTVTWTLENTGTSTWTTSYYIQFFSGEQMEAEEKVFLPYPVPPGTNVQISVDFKAPESEGSKQSNWILNNSNDETFYSFYVIIDVVKDNPPAPPPNTPEPSPSPTATP